MMLSNPKTHLVIACKNNIMWMVKYIVENTAMEIRNNVGNGLCWASKYGYLEIVKYLFNSGFKIYTFNYSIENICKNGHLEVVKYLHEKGANIHYSQDKAVRYAGRKGHLEVVKYLHQNGADLCAKKGVLYEAIANGRLEVIKYLCENRISEVRHKAIHLATKKGYSEVVKYLYDIGLCIHTPGGLIFRVACKYGHLELVKYFIENKANARSCDNAPICSSSRRGHLDVVKYLHQNGADIHTRDNYPIRSAIKKGHHEVVKYLSQFIQN